MATETTAQAQNVLMLKDAESNLYVVAKTGFVPMIIQRTIVEKGWSKGEIVGIKPADAKWCMDKGVAIPTEAAKTGKLSGAANVIASLADKALAAAAATLPQTPPVGAAAALAAMTAAAAPPPPGVAGKAA